jgi:UDP-N-acetylglucosamine 2-epimerase
VRVLDVVGTRPQLIKVAALQPALRARHDEVFVDTGQHWDPALAGSFFAELDLPAPDHSLGIGGGSGTEQVGRMLLALEAVIGAERPDVVLVYGDTNSTLAGALAAARAGVPVAHVEAGLRSFDRQMPEEVNRVLADHLSSWLFAPTPAAVANLAAEGMTTGVMPVGDLMQDLAARVSATVRDPGVLAGIEATLGQARGIVLTPGSYVFATIHRAENREPAAIASWSAILADAALGGARTVILALHPGTRAAIEAAGMSLAPAIRVVDPLGYRTTLALQLHAAAVLTDSGGVQREAAWLRTPCLVLRGTTEWVEAVAGSGGTMVVTGLDRDRAGIELARLAPPERAAELAVARAASLDLRPAGAAVAIADAIAEGVPRSAGRAVGSPAVGGSASGGPVDGHAPGDLPGPHGGGTDR